ncbi:MAG TPA: hypothetical protein VJ692_08300 [Nitrospiraceae bacterium]|nr:hypothetical protein [Nitrospiraceae bacterium]
MGVALTSRVCVGLVLLWCLSSCVGPLHERRIYDQGGIQIGIQHDLTTDRTSPPALNNHPAHLTSEEISRLLGWIQVSGYTGTLAGLVVTPPRIPLFSGEELRLIASPIAVAFGRAGPRERVFFSLPNLQAPYERDRTEGSLFLRGERLYVLLTDHAAFTQTDTGGSDDDKDPHNTKGLALWVRPPARAETVSAEEMPFWGPFHTVHTALNVRAVLAARTPLPARSDNSIRQPLPPGQSPTAAKDDRGPAGLESEQDLRLQIRELTSSNLELRARLEEQAKEMRALKDELSRVQRDLEKAAQRLQPRRKGSAGVP